MFKAVGTAAAVGAAVAGVAIGPLAGAIAATATAAYWKVGLDDMRQTKHTILRNFPVLGHVRYALEGIRPGAESGVGAAGQWGGLKPAILSCRDTAVFYRV